MKKIIVNSVLEWECKVLDTTKFNKGEMVHAIVRHERGYSHMFGCLSSEIKMDHHIASIDVNGWEERGRYILPDEVTFDPSLHRPENGMMQLLHLSRSEPNIMQKMHDCVDMVKMRIRARIFKEVKHLTNTIKTSQQKIDWLMELDV